MNRKHTKGIRLNDEEMEWWEDQENPAEEIRQFIQREMSEQHQLQKKLCDKLEKIIDLINNNEISQVDEKIKSDDNNEDKNKIDKVMDKQRMKKIGKSFKK